jgi:hypothetical protein
LAYTEAYVGHIGNAIPGRLQQGKIGRFSIPATTPSLGMELHVVLDDLQLRLCRLALRVGAEAWKHVSVQIDNHDPSSSSVVLPSLPQVTAFRDL